MGDTSGVEAFDVGEAGMATRVDVRVVERGIDALRRARSDVWRRWGKRGRDCHQLAYTFSVPLFTKQPTGSTAIEPSSSGKLRTWSVICTSVRGIALVRMILRSVL